MCPQPDLNRHTKALAIELQGHVRLAVCTTIVIICEVYRALSHRLGAEVARVARCASYKQVDI